MPAFKITDIVEPLWEVEFPGGEKKKYDPWKLEQAIQTEQAKQTEGPDGVKQPADPYEAIRIAFGLPLESEKPNVVDADGNITTWNTFTRNQAIGAVNGLHSYIKDLPVSKKASSLSQK